MPYQKLLSDPRSPYVNLQGLHENLILEYEQNQSYQNSQPFVTYPYQEEIEGFFYTQPESANGGIADAVGMPTYQELKPVTWLDTWHDINNTIGAYSQLAGNALNLASMVSTVASAAQGLQWLLSRPPRSPSFHVNPRPVRKNPDNLTHPKPNPWDTVLGGNEPRPNPGDAVLGTDPWWHLNRPAIDMRPHRLPDDPFHPFKKGLTNQPKIPKGQRPLPPFPTRPC